MALNWKGRIDTDPVRLGVLLMAYLADGIVHLLTKQKPFAFEIKREAESRERGPERMT